MIFRVRAEPILAAINAVHTSARDARDTGWSQAVALYDQLVRLDPSPIIALNRAIEVAELDAPEVAPSAVDRVEDTLAGYHAYPATRADCTPGFSATSRCIQPLAWRSLVSRFGIGVRTGLFIPRRRSVRAGPPRAT